mmetsp:Transcript_28911/g.63292  ORF Transcript_28911/g.63292 Transcript_28911/m.63292 type:complete len:251 (+) Transcript_28911:434-1186(+)
MGAVIHHDHLDLVAVLQALELLKILLQLQGCGGKRSIHLQELRVVALQAQMELVLDLLVDLTLLVVGDHAAREVDGIPVLIRDALDAAQDFNLAVSKSGAGGAVHSVRGLLEGLHNTVDDLRLDERLITLDVHHDVILLGQLELCGVAPLGSVGDLKGSHHDRRAESLASVLDALVIGSDHDLVAQLALHGLLPGALDHRLAGNHDQRLAWESCGGIARGNHTQHPGAELFLPQDKVNNGVDAENHVEFL